MIRSSSFLAVLGLVTLGGTARAQGLDTAELYQKVVKSCVFIVTPLKDGYATGSGSLIDADQRIILTNQHVVDENEHVFIQFPMFNKDGSVNGNKDTYMAKIPENKAIRGKVLHRDHTRDLAFVKLDPLPKGTAMPPAIPLAEKSAVQGANTWNIGSPGATPQLFSITEGRVRQIGYSEMQFAGGRLLKAVLVSSTNPTNPGDSGGPLFNKYGQQVAVTQSVLRGVQQVNFFVDISEVKAYLKEQKIVIKAQPTPDAAKAEPKKDSEIPVQPPTDRVLKTPPVAKTPTPKVDAPAPKVATPAPSTADEEAAQKRLTYVKDVISQGSTDRYRKALTEITQKWPGTKAAKEAETITKSLK
jgi:hypothetical protein